LQKPRKMDHHIKDRQTSNYIIFVDDMEINYQRDESVPNFYVFID